MPAHDPCQGIARLVHHEIEVGVQAQVILDPLEKSPHHLVGIVGVQQMRRRLIEQPQFRSPAQPSSASLMSEMSVFVPNQ